MERAYQSDRPESGIQLRELNNDNDMTLFQTLLSASGLWFWRLLTRLDCLATRHTWSSLTLFLFALGFGVNDGRSVEREFIDPATGCCHRHSRAGKSKGWTLAFGRALLGMLG